jgi:hypothetical protein
MIPPEVDAAIQLERIEQRIAEYRREKRRQLLRRALKFSRKAERDYWLRTFELPPELVH